MVEVQSLELDGQGGCNEDDLFYLVDSVLDEIIKAKALKDIKSEQNLDDIVEIMPTADIEDSYNTDLMDQIESALSPFDDGSQFPLTFGDTRSSHANHYQQMTQTANNFADDLVEQICMDNEYLSCVAKDSACMPNYSYTKSSATVAIHTRDMDVPEDIIQSAFALQNFTKYSRTSAIDRISPQINDSIIKNDIVDSDESHNKEFYKNFDELQKYSDLIQLPDMTSRYQPIPSSSAQVEPVNYSQHKKPEEVLQTHQFFDEDSNDTTTSEFMSWTTLHPENWSGTEVLDWLYYSAEKHGVDCSLLRGEAFRTLSGKMLCNMGVMAFRELDPFYGDFLYKLFRQLLSGLQFTLNPESSFSDQSSIDQSFGYIESQSECYSLATSPSDVSHHSGDVSSCHSSTHTSPNIYQQGAERLGPYDFLYAAPPGSSTPQVDDVSHVQAGEKPYRYTMDVHHPMSYTFDYQTPVTTCTTNSKTGYKAAARERYDTDGTPRRRPGRPRVKSIPTEEELQAQKEKKLKSQHLWEFIYDMLNNHMYNPTILKWENQKEGIFRFIQSESVAQLWGTLKSNENMTYEKLSRAMRHYYKRGILERVEGRRLVYKFSKVTLDRMNQKKRPDYVIETPC